MRPCPHDASTPGFISLDASRPWICYWVLHGLALLQAPLPQSISASHVITFLQACQHASGGHGGGPGHMPHLAPTYAAVCALVTLGGREAYDSIDRAGVWGFLCRMASAAVRVHASCNLQHAGGECDARSCFTALAVASALCLDVPCLVARSGWWTTYGAARQQMDTYEGGLGGEPGNEAHGGYTFCGLAALVLAGCPHALDLQRLLRWAVQRQGWSEGGFNGRTNKLVDGCYSFWQGGVFPLLQRLLQGQHTQEEQLRQVRCGRGLAQQMHTIGATAASTEAGKQEGTSPEDVDSAAANPLFNPRALQCWLLRACQQLKGGLRDKPGKSADYYHSCYCLSGLSTAQHIAGGGVVGFAQNVLWQVDPLLNVLAEKLQQAKEHFSALPRLE
ncbi:terpenoid cyclases/Protein prenyltransferase [Scenedesmus sp. NREL 46B-D3]|nr:terpenoid cyclases/Protein prenyltransferase [Scenedesmus sp. NREL 46B-D3]